MNDRRWEDLGYTKPSRTRFILVYTILSLLCLLAWGTAFWFWSQIR